MEYENSLKDKYKQKIADYLPEWFKVLRDFYLNKFKKYRGNDREDFYRETDK